MRSELLSDQFSIHLASSFDAIFIKEKAIWCSASYNINQMYSKTNKTKGVKVYFSDSDWGISVGSACFALHLDTWSSLHKTIKIRNLYISICQNIMMIYLCGNSNVKLNGWPALYQRQLGSAFLESRTLWIYRQKLD